MVSFTEIKELIQHPDYIRFMEQVQKSSGVSIEETLPDLAGLNIIAKRINGAKVNVDLLLNLIKEDGDCLHKYILAWLDRASKRIGRKLDEEYPEGEEQDDSSVPYNVRVLPRDRGFIIYPIIVYHIIKNKHNELFAFYKWLRKPYAKARSEEAIRFYEEVFGKEKLWIVKRNVLHSRMIELYGGHWDSRLLCASLPLDGQATHRHANALVRQYLLKYSSFTGLTAQEIKEIESGVSITVQERS